MKTPNHFATLFHQADSSRLVLMWRLSRLLLLYAKLGILPSAALENSSVDYFVTAILLWTNSSFGKGQLWAKKQTIKLRHTKFQRGLTVHPLKTTSQDQRSRCFDHKQSISMLYNLVFLQPIVYYMTVSHKMWGNELIAVSNLILWEFNAAGIELLWPQSLQVAQLCNYIYKYYFKNTRRRTPVLIQKTIRRETFLMRIKKKKMRIKMFKSVLNSSPDYYSGLVLPETALGSSRWMDGWIYVYIARHCSEKAIRLNTC